MKIVCISASQIPSSTANSIQAMKACQALAQLGHELTLLVPGQFAQEDLARFYGLRQTFPVAWLAGSRRLFPWRAVRRALQLKPDLLYVWPLQAALFGLQAGLPVLLEMHDLPSGRFGPLWYRWFLRARGQKRLLLITQALRRALDEAYAEIFPTVEAIVAPNGVDLERFDSLPDPVAARRQLSLPSAETVLCTGHLYAGRGADLFLELARVLPEVHFLWVGGRAQEVQTWRARAEREHLSNVTFAGFIPNQELPLYQAAADVLLMPYGLVIAISSGMGHSASVASPMKMFEYLAAGRAIVTSDLPVIREVLNEANAVFCPPEDLAAWQTAVKNLLDNPGWRETLGRQARRDAEGYTWQARARKTLEGFPRA